MGRKLYVLKIEDSKEKLSDRAMEIDAQVNYLKVKTIIKDLKDTMYANPDIISLAAPQIGQAYRIFCIRFSNGDIRAFINPMIIKREDLVLSREVNASIKGKEFIIPRNKIIHAAYQLPTGNSEVNKFEDAPGFIFQQMVDLLDGVLLDDYGLEVIPEFDEASDEEREEVIKAYIDSLKLEETNLKDEINANPELKKMNDSIEFMTKVALGDVKLEKITQEEAKEINANVKELSKKAKGKKNGTSKK